MVKIKVIIVNKTIFYFLIILVLTSLTICKDWYLYASKTFGFKIELPNKPIVTKENINTEIGNLTIYSITYDPKELKEKDENLTYLINYIEYPISSVNSTNKKQLESIYSNSIASGLKNSSGKLVDLKNVNVKGYEGKEALIDISGNVKLTTRLILIKNKLYMLQVFSKGNKSSNISLKRFINSFDLE